MSDETEAGPLGVQQPGACITTSGLAVDAGLGKTTNVVLFTSGFAALSYFHIASSDDYLFVGADDEVLSLDASANVRHDSGSPAKPPSSVLVLMVDSVDPSDPTGSYWQADPDHFQVTPVTTAAGELHIVTELESSDPSVGLNVLVTKRPVRLEKPTP